MGEYSAGSKEIHIRVRQAERFPGVHSAQQTETLEESQRTASSSRREEQQNASAQIQPDLLKSKGELAEEFREEQIPGDISSEANTSSNVLSKKGQNERASAAASEDNNGGRTFHTLVTSNGSPYLNFQTRIMSVTSSIP